MRPLEYRINLDFANESSDIFCNVRQGDNCSKIVAALREDGRAYDIEGDNLSVVFAALKSDGNTIYDDCTVENNTIIYDFNNQTAPVSGTVPCQFILIDSENGEAKRISTPVFFLEISDNVDIDEENIVSSESYTALTNKIAQAQALINQIQHDLDTGAYKGDPGADGFSPTATVTKSGHTATITITDKNGTTTAEISDGDDGDTAFANVQLVGSSVYPNIDTATSSKRFYIVFDGSSFYGLLRFSGNVSTGTAAISVSQIMYTKTGELLKRIGTTSYGSVTWTGDWTPIASEGSGATIINTETVPESADWDGEIPTTYAGQTGEKGEIAFWNGELWYLYNVATLGQTTYYHWDKVAVTEDLEAKMDLAPLNPTTEQIAALPSGQIYSDVNAGTVDIKNGVQLLGVLNNGQNPELIGTQGKLGQISYYNGKFYRCFGQDIGGEYRWKEEVIPDSATIEARFGETAYDGDWVITSNETLLEISHIMKKYGVVKIVNYVTGSQCCLITRATPEKVCGIVLAELGPGSGNKTRERTHILMQYGQQSDKLNMRTVYKLCNTTDYYTKTEIDQKGYLTLETLPIYDGTVI